MCLATQRSDAGDIPNTTKPGEYTFIEIDHEMISLAILVPSADSKRVVVS